MYKEIIGRLASDDIAKEWSYTTEGYKCNHSPCMEHPPRIGENEFTRRIEDWADMLMNWNLDVTDPNQAYEYNGFTFDQMGQNRRDWMNSAGDYPGVGIIAILRAMGLLN